MAENKFVVCFNAMEKRFFEVSAVHLVQEPFRRNFYRLSLRLNFYYGDVDMDRTDGHIRQLCLRKITNLMTAQNMWQNHHSFYEIKYEIRVVARNNDDLIQQNGEKNNESSDTESTSASESDSAYSSSGPFASDESFDESVHYWADETVEDFGGSEDLTSSDDE